MPGRIVYTLIGLVSVALLLVACGEKKPDSESAEVDSIPSAAPEAPITLAMPADSLIGSETATISQVDIGLTTDLWYNLMPGPDDNEPPQLNLKAALTVKGDAAMPPGITVDYAWVTIGGGTWGIQMAEQPMIGDKSLEQMFRGGPIYDEETIGDQTASVVVRVRNAVDAEFYLKTTDQAIEKVY